jgi:hypothetical protein
VDARKPTNHRLFLSANGQRWHNISTGTPYQNIRIPISILSFQTSTVCKQRCGYMWVLCTSPFCEIKHTGTLYSPKLSYLFICYLYIYQPCAPLIVELFRNDRNSHRHSHTLNQLHENKQLGHLFISFRFYSTKI